MFPLLPKAPNALYLTPVDCPLHCPAQKHRLGTHPYVLLEVRKLKCSHPRINCEETGEESNGEDHEESDWEYSDVGEAKDVDKSTSHDHLVEAIDLSAKEKEVVQFGPPRGRCQAKSGSNHPEPITEDVDKSTSHDQLVKGNILVELTCLNINISGLAPPEQEEPVNGSSHSTGDAVIENATSLLNVRSPCYDTLGPILKKSCKVLFSCAHFVPEHNYHVYVLDQKQWSIMGCYNVVVEDDETAVWEEDETGKVTHILLEKDHKEVFASAISPLFHWHSTSIGSHSASVPR
ncbi:uncharacterized protein LACBIDRAFT_334111 [Laccaria bicolor S238N-H82]|uniref:Predicted protein n=1 Tax=Laccaria bicolor (strain S238N-H82 / ATCC MYA-4686) TaxID=486041 RepID=B0DY43_LACBS|nr:uncharacterized protein LACBIDRAFT_334111 [Laccaria bicolor S238N-H82]EDR00453.1 predicted protein [Laccaria bicolor S238N-H82]|eukprot:XP_001888845.1 predicted protein [Laccaria bicolor S238N-H82]